MSRKLYILYIVIFIISLSAIILIIYNRSMPNISINFNESGKSTPHINSQDLAKNKVHLYFADKNNAFLIAEERSILQSSNPVEFGKTIIETLIKGPFEGLMRTIPVGTTLRAFYITQDGTAYVDLTEEVKELHPGGIKTELITIYSIVNSLTLNVSEINAVKILIEGHEAMNLAGHIDLRFPFKANILLIK